MFKLNDFMRENPVDRVRGIEASLVYGVNKDGSGFSAHAWVEAGGVSTNNAPEEFYRRFKA